MPELIKSEHEARSRQSKLANELSELKKQKGIVEAPEKAEAYLEAEGLFDGDGNLTMAENETDRIRAIPADDPALSAFADIAHKNKLSQDQFQGIVGDFLTAMNPLMPEPLNEEAELAALGKDGKQIVQACRTWADGLLAAGRINDIGHGMAVAMGATAEGVKLINEFRALSGEMQIPLGGPVDGGTMVTREEWYANTPNREASPQEWADWEKQGEELFGTAPAGTSPSGMGMPRSRSGVSTPVHSPAKTKS